MNDDLSLVLKEDINLLDKVADILVYSYNKCKEIGIKEEYSYEELDKFESFTSRFARLSDFLIYRIFRLIDKIDLESEGTFRDIINRSEKKEIIKSAEIFIEIRILRNQIVHEYIQDDIQGLFKKVLDYTPYLFDSIDRVKKYTEKYNSAEEKTGK